MFRIGAWVSLRLPLVSKGFLLLLYWGLGSFKASSFYQVYCKEVLGSHYSYIRGF